MAAKHRCQIYMDEYIYPYIHDRRLYNAMYEILSTWIYFTPYSTVKKKLKGKTDKPLVSRRTKAGCKAAEPGYVLDHTPATMTYIGELAHDWWETGLLTHSMSVHQHAMQLWQLWKSTIPCAWYKDPKFRKWFQETEDAIAIGSFLHDIGKAGTRFKSFKGHNTQYMHEQIGYELVKEFAPCHADKLEQAVKGHSAFFIKDNRIHMKSKKFQPYDTKTYCQLAPFIVCFADKIASAKSAAFYKKELSKEARKNNQKEEYEMLRREAKQAAKAAALYERHFTQGFIQNSYHNYTLKNMEITYKFRDEYGFKLYLHD